MIHRKLILVAHSREEALILFHQVLSRHGYDVVLAATAEETLAQARRHRPDLILLAPDLAGAGGLPLSRRLRNEPETAAVPLGALAEDPGPERTSLDGEFCGVVAQRAPLQALLDAVRRCLDGGRGSGSRGGLAGTAPAAA